jgi:hypothetical protein
MLGVGGDRLTSRRFWAIEYFTKQTKAGKTQNRE